MTVISLTIHATVKLVSGYTATNLADDVEHDLRRYGGLQIHTISTAATIARTAETTGVAAVAPIDIDLIPSERST